jgi:hypothetical protein
MRSWSKFASHLRLRDQRSMWMQDECKVYMDSYMTSNGPCFMVTWIIFKNHIFESNRPNTNPGDHGTRDAYNRWFILFHHMWKPTWIEIHWNNIWLRAHVTYDFTLHLRIRDHTTWCCWRWIGTAFGRFSFGLSQVHGHGSWLVCEVALSKMWLHCFISNSTLH